MGGAPGRVKLWAAEAARIYQKKRVQEFSYVLCYFERATLCIADDARVSFYSHVCGSWARFVVRWMGLRLSGQLGAPAGVRLHRD